MNGLPSVAVLLLLLTLTGCTISGTHSDTGEKWSVNTRPLIGLIGMAVDGDDKDDYEHFFEEECNCNCRCSKCRE